jgi:ABC-type sugar transport system substrate-binding protein
MRFVVAFFMLFAAVGFGASKATASPKDKRIALLSMANTNPWVSAWTSTFIKDAQALGMKVTNLASPYDAAMQSQQVDDAIAQKFDIIAVEYANDQAIIPALTRAKAAGVPVVLWATPLQKQHEDLFMSYVGTDHTELGRVAGENLVKALAEEGKTNAQVVVITGLAQQLMVQMRMAGFQEVLSKHPSIKIVAQEDGKWNTAVSEKIASELLVRFNARGGIDGIFGMADNQATGVIQAADSAGLKLGVVNKGLVVVASNCMKDGIINIKAGQQFSTATQIPTVEAQTTAKKIADYFNGVKLKKYEYIKSDAITHENVEKFAAACSY